MSIGKFKELVIKYFLGLVISHLSLGGFWGELRRCIPFCTA